ncbi:MAG: hypothetical protein ABIU20_08915 [Blastocatellia bacterium]
MNGTALEKITDIPSEETIERSSEDLRQEIKDKKEAIAETLNRLDQRVHRAIDWRAQVGDHPYLALGLAVSVGCLFSGIFNSTSSPRERIMDALAEGVEDITDQVRNSVNSQFSRPSKGNALKAAALALATKAATTYLSNKLSSTPKARNTELNRFSQ